MGNYLPKPTGKNQAPESLEAVIWPGPRPADKGKACVEPKKYTRGKWGEQIDLPGRCELSDFGEVSVKKNTP